MNKVNGFGNYGSQMGGYGAFIDCRTRNKYGVFAHTIDEVAIIEISIEFCLVEIG